MKRAVVGTGVVALLALGGCARSEAAPAVGAPPGDGTLPRLVFFLNPNGAPCQAQERILADLAPELQGRAEIVRYSTTVPGDRGQFAKFGIRSLPTLVVTDAGGRELRRAPPGIQSADQVRRLLGR